MLRAKEKPQGKQSENRKKVPFLAVFWRFVLAESKERD
jgi:hypothetical protein